VKIRKSHFVKISATVPRSIHELKVLNNPQNGTHLKDSFFREDVSSLTQSFIEKVNVKIHV